MTQPWYSTVDDYSIALWNANVKLGTKGIPGLLGRVGISHPVSIGILAASNAIALGALVITDPANLRDQSAVPFRGQEMKSIIVSDEFQELATTLASNLRQGRDLMDPPEGIMLNDEGFIEVV
tara:strand:- start:231 stop:599 length:369 start_codon:yes stop_codon:yes gene_type:complete